MKIGEIIQNHLQQNDLSQRQFAKKCDLSNGYISMLINNVNPKTGKPLIPSLSALMALSQGLGISLNELLSIADDIEINIGKIKNISTVPGIFPLKTKKLPIMGEIACGKPIFAEESYDGYIDIEEGINADFCLRAKGDSMIGARIMDGDIVIVKKQDMVQNGEIAVVLIDDEATLKRAYYYPDKNKLILNPENPKYEPLVFIGEELNSIRILGKAVAFQSVIR